MIRSFAGLVAAAAVSTTGMAADAGSNVTAHAKSLKVGAMYSTELTHNDGGFMKTEGDTSSHATGSIGVSIFDLKLEGELSGDASFKMVYNMVGNDLELGYATWWVCKGFGISAGKKKVFQGGFENKYKKTAYASTAYAETLKPFSSFAPVFELLAQVDVAGTVTLQMTDDSTVGSYATTVDEKGEVTGKKKQPAMILAWEGEFGPLFPMVTFGSYDMNHSKFFTVGAKLEHQGIMGLAEYVADMRNRPDPTDATKAVTDNMSVINIEAGYTMEKMMGVSFKYAMFDTKQAGTDIKGNAAGSVDPTAFFDNNNVWTLGATCLTEGPHFAPYVAFVGRSGNNLKAGSATDVEAKSDLSMVLGFGGEF